MGSCGWPGLAGRRGWPSLTRPISTWENDEETKVVGDLGVNVVRVCVCGGGGGHLRITATHAKSPAPRCSAAPSWGNIPRATAYLRGFHDWLRRLVHNEWPARGGEGGWAWGTPWQGRYLMS